jgi:hypothetical protein
MEERLSSPGKVHLFGFSKIASHSLEGFPIHVGPRKAQIDPRAHATFQVAVHRGLNLEKAKFSSGLKKAYLQNISESQVFPRDMPKDKVEK